MGRLPSKLDQLRALREAGQTESPQGRAIRAAERLRELRKELAPLLAAPGRCASCDRRRAALEAGKKRYREKKKGG